MQVDMSVRDFALLIAAIADRQVKLRSDAEASRRLGDVHWAEKAEAELVDLQALKERIWNA